MRVALALARRQLGRTWPNPAVGAVIVRDGQIIAEGVTANNGRPHAETIAIKNAGELADGATLYVTLEPCSHHGKTPPCVDAIANSGIKKVVLACRDKNPVVVNGNGILLLKTLGIDVIENICAQEAAEINRGFFSLMEKGRPFVALKIATSIDDKITNPDGRWITGEQARNYGHLLRAQYDAILTGSGTVIADDPELTCRLPGLENHSPLRVVMAGSKPIPQNAKILGEQDIATTLVMQNKNIAEVIQELAARGITRLLVEAGAKLTAEFLESGLVDIVYWFRAPMVAGDTGLSVANSLAKLANFTKTEHIELGNDNLEIYECSAG